MVVSVNGSVCLNQKLWTTAIEFDIKRLCRNQNLGNVDDPPGFAVVDVEQSVRTHMETISLDSPSTSQVYERMGIEFTRF